MEEISRHWDAVYGAMRRAETAEPEKSSERDQPASDARFQGGASTSADR